MNRSNNVLFAALLASICTSSSSLHARMFDMDAFEEQLEQQLEQMNQSMRQMRKQIKQTPFFVAPSFQTISLTTNDKNVIITIANIEIDNVEARLNEANNQLVITTPTKKFVIATRDNIIALEAQEIMQQKSKDDAKNNAVQFSGTSMYRSQSSVGGKLLLEKQSMDYNADKKELIITIPLQQVSKGKVVPINKLTSEISSKTQEASKKEDTPQQK